MRYLLPAVLGALNLFYFDGVAAQDVPACVPSCANTVRDQFAQYSCVSASDAACLCANANFGFGVRDCGQSGCGATDVEIQSFLAGGFCQGQQLAFTPTGVQATPTPPASSTAPPSQTTSPTSETTPAPSSPPPSSTPPASETAPPSSSSTTVPPSSTSAPAGPPSAPPTQTSAPVTTPPHSNSTIPVSTPTSPPSTTASVPSSTSASTSSATASETSAAAAAGGLSQGAAIGIGIGVAGAVVAVVFGGVFFFLKKRGQSHDSFDISQPPSSSGRGQGAFEKYSNDIEMVSNRYEDMVPRQQPRAIV